MTTKAATITYEDLPDTITPLDYAEWRRMGENKAREKFNSEGFPRIEGTGAKQLADKRAVLFYDLGLSKEERQEIIKEIAKAMIEKGRDTNEER